MAEGIRVDLEAPLAGKFLLVDADGVTFGMLEDLQSWRAATIMDSLAVVIVGGNVPGLAEAAQIGDEAARGRAIRAALRRLKKREINSLIEGVLSAPDVPKS